ncbi:MAG: threonine/serine exporter ThrE family protein [Gaiellaceae bacterium]
MPSSTETPALEATESAPPGGDGSDAVAFLLRFTEVAHTAGYPTDDLEERVLAVAAHLGLAAPQISSTPTLVELSFGTLAAQRSYTFRVRPQAVDLDAIARLDDVVHDVVDGRIAPSEALDRLADIQSHALHRHWLVRLAAYALAGAAVTPVLGGGWREIVSGGVVGLVVGGIALAAKRAARTEVMLAPLAALGASFCAAVIANLGLNASPDVVTLAALVTVLPGMALTIGVRELATEHLQSGVANTAMALVQLLGLVFGVGVGRSVAASWFGSPAQSVPHTAFSGTHVLAAIAAGLAFTVTLRAQSRAAPIMCAATVIAVIANASGRALFGAAAGVFFAALAIGIIGGLVSGVGRRSPLVFIVPGVLILVPGSAGFNSLLKLLTGQTVSGIDAGFNTFVTAMSIAYGLMLSTVVLPRRFTGIGTSGAARA